MTFKRKIYDKFLEWKKNSDGRTALLVEGARRIGKSTIVEEFAKNEYESYSLIDFTKASAEIIKHLVADHRYDYMETGSLISIRKNVKDILIPSEERPVQMYPMDYEEFKWAFYDHAFYGQGCF